MNLKLVESLEGPSHDAKSRGVRLKMCRVRHGYCMGEFSQKLGIPESTLYAWEKGRSPLSLKGAKKIILFLEGTLSSGRLEWLMYGETSLHPAISPETSDDLLAIKDVNYFIHSREHAVVKVVLDDSLSPCLLPGDYVGGIKASPKQFDKLEGSLCIVESKEGETFFGVVGVALDEIMLYCLHHNMLKVFPKESVNFIASITWIRRKEVSVIK